MKEAIRIFGDSVPEREYHLATERGELVEIDTVRRDWVSTLTDLRGRLLAIPARIQATLPHLSPADVATIGDEVRSALEELAHADVA